jgi:hypothetical protein
MVHKVAFQLLSVERPTESIASRVAVRKQLHLNQQFAKRLTNRPWRKSLTYVFCTSHIPQQFIILVQVEEQNAQTVGKVLLTPSSITDICSHRVDVYKRRISIGKFIWNISVGTPELELVTMRKKSPRSLLWRLWFHHSVSIYALNLRMIITLMVNGLERIRKEAVHGLIEYPSIFLEELRNTRNTSEQSMSQHKFEPSTSMNLGCYR